MYILYESWLLGVFCVYTWNTLHNHSYITGIVDTVQVAPLIYHHTVQVARVQVEYCKGNHAHGMIFSMFDRTGVEACAKWGSPLYTLWEICLKVTDNINVSWRGVYIVSTTTSLSACTSGGYMSSQSSLHIHQYATPMSPNKGETAVCGSTIFCLGWLGRRSLVLGSIGRSHHSPACCTLFAVKLAGSG